MTTLDERFVGGWYVFGDYVQSTADSVVLVHEECGRVFAEKQPLDNDVTSDWLPFCTECFNTTCDRCGAQHYDPAIATGDPDQADPLCGSCWGGLLSQ
ncbi:MAG: hypothetical protein KDB63_08880 [Nocardioidaceae bacterium]|nr:hypothetical protein [Nocardioidaceae bacterium]